MLDPWCTVMVTVLAPGAGGEMSMIFGPGLTTAGRRLGSSGGGEAASALDGASTVTGTGTATGTGTTTTGFPTDGEKKGRPRPAALNGWRCEECLLITTGGPPTDPGTAITPRPPPAADPGRTIRTAKPVMRRAGRRRNPRASGASSRDSGEGQVPTNGVDAAG